MAVVVFMFGRDAEDEGGCKVSVLGRWMSAMATR
jgi:hypothetical protein